MKDHICHHCNRPIGRGDESFQYQDCDNWDADEEGYVIICKHCARKVLRTRSGESVVDWFLLFV